MHVLKLKIKKPVGYPGMHLDGYLTQKEDLSSDLNEARTFSSEKAAEAALRVQTGRRSHWCKVLSHEIWEVKLKLVDPAAWEE